MERKRKVGIMGGTFNPIHNGHLLLAETAFHDFHLDTVMVMPSRNPYYKEISGSIRNDQRLAMVKLAIEDNENFVLSTLEFEREGNTYTADTLKELTMMNPNDEYYFIMGADSLYHFETWREPEAILSMTKLLVALRDTASTDGIINQIEYLQHKFGQADIQLLKSPSMEISSNDIRNRVKEQRSIRYLVPDKVACYIREQQLYS